MPFFPVTAGRWRVTTLHSTYAQESVGLEFAHARFGTRARHYSQARFIDRYWVRYSENNRTRIPLLEHLRSTDK